MLNNMKAPTASSGKFVGGRPASLPPHIITEQEIGQLRCRIYEENGTSYLCLDRIPLRPSLSKSGNWITVASLNQYDKTTKQDYPADLPITMPNGEPLQCKLFLGCRGSMEIPSAEDTTGDSGRTSSTPRENSPDLRDSPADEVESTIRSETGDGAEPTTDGKPS